MKDLLTQKVPAIDVSKYVGEGPIADSVVRVDGRISCPVASLEPGNRESGILFTRAEYDRGWR